MEERGAAPGITAVLNIDERHADLDGTVLDLAAVLDGLVGDRFEIVVVQVQVECAASDPVAEQLATLRIRLPRLPLRILDQRYADRAVALAAGFDTAAYDLIFVAPADGQFDVRELNHLLEAIEQGADLAVGYRARRDDGVVRRLQGWGWNLLVGLMFGKVGRDLDCGFKLFRRSVWKTVAMHPPLAKSTFCAELLIRARRLGFCVVEVPVSHHRPDRGVGLGPATPGEMRLALSELNQLRRELELEKTQPVPDPAATNTGPGVAIATGRRAA